MHILPLTSDRVGLEFSEAERAHLFAELEAYGHLVHTVDASHEIIVVGGVEFTVMSDWDEPCLISKNAAGDDILRTIAASDGPRQPRV